MIRNDSTFTILFRKWSWNKWITNIEKLLKTSNNPVNMKSLFSHYFRSISSWYLTLQFYVFSNSYLYRFIIFFSLDIKFNFKGFLHSCNYLNTMASISWFGSCVIPSMVLVNSIVTYFDEAKTYFKMFFKCCWYYWDYSLKYFGSMANRSFLYGQLLFTDALKNNSKVVIYEYFSVSLLSKWSFMVS